MSRESSSSSRFLLLLLPLPSLLSELDLIPSSLAPSSSRPGILVLINDSESFPLFPSSSSQEVELLFSPPKRASSPFRPFPFFLPCSSPAADWELEQELDYVLEDGDEIVFISTLHGG